MSRYDPHHHNADPAYTDPSLKERKNANERAGGWLGLVLVAVLAAGLLAWFTGAFDAEDERIAGLATAEGEAAVVERRVDDDGAVGGLPSTEPRADGELIPTDGAAVVIPQEGPEAAIVANDGQGGAEVIDMPQLVKPKLATPGDAEYVGPVDDKTTVTTVPQTLTD